MNFNILEWASRPFVGLGLVFVGDRGSERIDLALAGRKTVELWAKQQWKDLSSEKRALMLIRIANEIISQVRRDFFLLLKMRVRDISSDVSRLSDVLRRLGGRPVAPVKMDIAEIDQIPEALYETDFFNDRTDPISDVPIRYPVHDVRHAQHVFEQASILKWITEKNGTHPFTREPMTECDLVGDRILKKQIDAELQKYVDTKFQKEQEEYLQALERYESVQRAYDESIARLEAIRIYDPMEWDHGEYKRDLKIFLRIPGH